MFSLCESVLNVFWDMQYPFLNSGVMFASFHSEGTVPSSSDKLNNFASGVLICSTIALSNFGGIPSTPGDFFIFRLHNFVCYHYRSYR